MNTSASTSYSSVVKTLNQSIKSVPTSSVACQTTTTWLHHLNPRTSPSTDLGQRVLYPSNKVQQTTQTSSPASSAKPSSSQSTAKPSSSEQHSSPTSQVSIQSSKSRSRSKGPKGDKKSSNSPKHTSGRLRKGEDDPIHTYNTYGLLEDGMEIDPSPPRSKSPSSPRPGRTRSPVKPPKS